jgi:hypothetical protein
MAIKIGNSKTGVTISGSDTQFIEQFIGKNAALVVALMEEEIEEVYVNAYDAWPKPGAFLYNSSRSRKASRYQRMNKTPFILRRTEPESAEGLKWEVRIDNGATLIVGRVWNNVSYAKFIKANELAGLSVFVELLRKPMGKLNTRFPKLVIAAIAEASDG